MAARTRGGRTRARRWLALLVPCALALAPAVASAQIPLRAYYDDDFILETEDGAFQLRIRGNLHLDTRLYQAENPGAIQNLDVRRARIDLMGRLYQRFTFRVQPELAGSPYIRNAWADWALSRGLHLRWGQMKVPFSSSWLTQDNNVNFVERGSASPVHPFFDRGFVLRGELLDGTVTYDVGVFTGVGTDADVPTGDVDSGKEWAGRLFLRPFLDGDGPLRGLILVAGATWADRTGATRVESRGMRAPDFGAALWRWRTEQVLGTDGHATDRIAAEIDARRRLGLELHWVRGPLTFSAELLEIRYHGIAIHHDFLAGGDRLAHQPVLERSGAVRSWSAWVSGYVTGESKRLTDGGWRTARPDRRVGEGGPGAVELLARYSRTESDPRLFDAAPVTGLQPGAPALPAGYGGTTPGAGNTVTAAVLDGAHTVNEVTLGVNWTLNPMVRIQVNDVFQWAPHDDRDGDGANDNLLVSGAFTAADPAVRFRRTEWQNALMIRFIFKL
jgi:phosphate-selective porin